MIITYIISCLSISNTASALVNDMGSLKSPFEVVSVAIISGYCASDSTERPPKLRHPAFYFRAIIFCCPSEPVTA